MLEKKTANMQKKLKNWQWRLGTRLASYCIVLLFFLCRTWCRKYYKGYKERLSRRRQFGYASFLELTTETNRAPDFTVTSVRLSDF